MNREEVWAFWQHRTLVSGIPPTRPPERCSLADDFQELLEEQVFGPLERDPTLGKITQAKYLLQEWYHERRYLDTAQHPGASSTCVYAVYEAAYDRLQRMKLRLRPTSNLIVDYDELVIPALQASPTPEPAPLVLPPPQIAGIFLGNEDES